MADRASAADETPLRGGDSRPLYNQTQYGCLWILFLIGGITGIAGTVATIFATGSYQSYVDAEGGWFYFLMLICWALATVWVRIEDRGEHLLIHYGPCRWLLCGMGKEKIPYDIIRDFGVTQTCAYGFGIPNAHTIKLFNTCSCCCGNKATYCGHTVVRITIEERPQGQNASDARDCFVERCFLKCCCGEKGRYIGKGCCFQPCCNPCDANCCMMNNIFVSTNDPHGLMQLLREKTGLDDSDHVRVDVGI